jgi:hypothetical protein
LRPLAVNQRFGSRESQRLIRTYNKAIEPADKLLIDGEHGTRLQKNLVAEYQQFFEDFDPDIVADVDPEPDGTDVVMSLRYAPETSWRWPEHTRGWAHIHRVEASVRPKALSSGGILDRRPEGFVRRLIQDANPFQKHRVVHLGLVEPHSPWAPLWVWSRIEGTRSAHRQAVQSGKRLREQRQFRALFLDELERLEGTTEWHGFRHPDLVLRLYADQLQNQLDLIFARESGLKGIEVLDQKTPEYAP